MELRGSTYQDSKKGLSRSSGKSHEDLTAIRGTDEATKMIGTRNHEELDMRLLWLIGMLAFLAGCAIDAVGLVHPQTGKELQCGPY